MRRFVMVAVIGILSLSVVSVAAASQCPKLIAQINAEVGNRFDSAAAEARAKAAEAEQLHRDGKHADSEKAAKDALQLLGIKS